MPRLPPVTRAVEPAMSMITGRRGRHRAGDGGHSRSSRLRQNSTSASKAHRTPPSERPVTVRIGEPAGRTRVRTRALRYHEEQGLRVPRARRRRACPPAVGGRPCTADPRAPHGRTHQPLDRRTPAGHRRTPRRSRVAGALARRTCPHGGEGRRVAVGGPTPRRLDRPRRAPGRRLASGLTRPGGRRRSRPVDGASARVLNMEGAVNPPPLRSPRSRGAGSRKRTAVTGQEPCAHFTRKEHP
ncbi:hypothetical protein J2S47_002731 [Streptomyces griseoviridis]|uniref:Uncharacterized protein n=1 Tax=Streptomyces griseoviridis TaxID=45398 RepID=A0ABT9LES9_STRGD|nr:hypothetical protein [Streptomyces griseoviridis]